MSGSYKRHWKIKKDYDGTGERLCCRNVSIYFHRIEERGSLYSLRNERNVIIATLGKYYNIIEECKC